MNIFKRLTFMVLVAGLFIFSGCQSDNSDVVASSTATELTDTNETNENEVVDGTDNTIDINGSISLVVMNGLDYNLTLNSEQVSITIKVLDVDNSPYSEGTVSIAYPDKVLSGADIGYFVSSKVEIDNGIATFSYTGPKDLQSLVDSDDTSTVFGFYYTTDVLSVKYYTFAYDPEDGQIVLTDYLLKESTSSDTYTMPLEDTRQMSFFVEDDAGLKVDDANITSIGVELLNPAIAELQDTFGNNGDILSFTNNNVSVTLVSGTSSGIEPIKVTAVFVDVNGDTRTIEEVFNVTILSGPPTAMSISYEGTIHDDANAAFQEVMIIKVTDKYSNLVNTQPAVSSYLITEYALENPADLSTRIFFGTSDAKAGTMSPTTNTLTSTADFTNVDLGNDFMLTNAGGYNYNVSGKWDILSIAGGVLTLTDTIDATSNVSEVSFAIGHNGREETCDDFGAKAIATVVLDSDKIGVNGTLRAVINYDYYLTGKSVAFGVDLVGFTADGDITSKFGHTVKHTLRSTGFEVATVSVPSGAVAVTYRMPVKITDTPRWYENANFFYIVRTSDNLSVNAVANSNGNVTDCLASGGVAYVDVTVTENLGETGTIEITDILVSGEF